MIKMPNTFRATSESLKSGSKWAIRVLRNAFSQEIGEHPPPRNPNNVVPYIFVMLFPENVTPPTPSALRNTGMAPNEGLWFHGRKIQSAFPHVKTHLYNTLVGTTLELALCIHCLEPHEKNDKRPSPFVYN